MDQHFRSELTTIINKHSVDNELNTPDWILCDFLIAMLYAFNAVQQKKVAFNNETPNHL